MNALNRGRHHGCAKLEAVREERRGVQSSAHGLGFLGWGDHFGLAHGLLASGSGNAVRRIKGCRALVGGVLLLVVLQVLLLRVARRCDGATGPVQL